MPNCRACGARVPDEAVLCETCRAGTAEAGEAPAEKKRRSLADGARTLACALAAFFLVKGAWGTVAAASYGKLAEEMGFPTHADAVHYASATLAIVVGVLYMVVAIGAFQRAGWLLRMTAASALAVVVGEIAVQAADAAAGAGGPAAPAAYSRAAALVAFWCALPIIHWVLSFTAAGRDAGTPSAPPS